MITIGALVLVIGMFIAMSNTYGLAGTIIGGIIAIIGVTILYATEAFYRRALSEFAHAIRDLGLKHNMLAAKVLKFDMEDIPDMPEELKELFKNIMKATEDEQTAEDKQSEETKDQGEV